METAALGFSEFLTGLLTIAFGAWSLAINGARKDLKEIRAEFGDGMAKLTANVTTLASARQVLKVLLLAVRKLGA